MTIGGSRIGFGRGPTKKLAQKTCYVDVAVYLEAYDPTLWKTFVAAAKTGQDLGMAPPVYCTMSESLEDEIYDLCIDVKKSALYKNALKLRPSLPDPDASHGAPGTQPASRRQRELPSFEEKDGILKERREKYLTDPTTEPMRNNRAALPIATRAQELLDHIRDNDVTICMAATGSGKTTQIPQLILDDYIDQGAGSKCNIICTQPRRLAAITVAQRVAKERGEQLGSSIGYQVWFESQLPEERGSVTPRTTGIFLKRMQSALDTSSTSDQGRSLDDVTHVLVDEVHERDVDTALLLVVLKRLLADRKAKGKLINVILMSTTKALCIASHHLKAKKQCVIFPTETIYGLDALTLNSTSSARIITESLTSSHSLRSHPSSNPLPITSVASRPYAISKTLEELVLDERKSSSYSSAKL